MPTSIEQLAVMVRTFRTDRGLSQTQLADGVHPVVPRTTVAHLEQARRLPDPEQLERICVHLRIPRAYWQPFLDRDHRRVFEFEQVLSELVGRSVSIDSPSDTVRATAITHILSLLDRDLTTDQTFDTFRSLLVYYGIKPATKQFYEHYFDADSFRSSDAFRAAVQQYQKDAIRLFSTFQDAYDNLATSSDLRISLSQLASRDDDSYRARAEWTSLIEIPEERLADLGYIAAGEVRKESAERTVISRFLHELAGAIRAKDAAALNEFGDKKRRKMDSLLRKFDPSSRHSLFSPLFLPDPDQLERKAEQIGPKEDRDIERMAETQSIAERNLAHYLSADHLDVYVATSMRSNADFVSVNRFVKALFSHDSIRPLKLRFFNPTQSWIEDRVAKGLVEALMLKRASLTIYMAQKDDTFGKDSEASVALGQGKPVIVYVPRLHIPALGIDTDALARAPREQLEALISREGTAEDREFDETMDEEALHGRLLTIRLANADGLTLASAAASHWADFDLYGEVDRIEKLDGRAHYRSWLDAIVKDGPIHQPPADLREQIVSILVATALRFERRAKIFREVHPLALQVILSSGVLNGILVARSVESCGTLIRALLKNELSLELKADDLNYRLIETTTSSTIRVISKHQLLQNAFATFYPVSRTPQGHRMAN